MNPAVQGFYKVIRDLYGLDEDTQMRIGRSNQEMEWSDLVVLDALAPMTRDSQLQSYDGESEVMHYGAVYSCPVVVSFYGSDAYDRTIDLSNRMRSQDAIELQRTHQVAVYGFSNVVDVKALTGVQYTGRVDMECVVKYTATTDVDTLRIDTLQYEQIDDTEALNYQKP